MREGIGQTLFPAQKDAIRKVHALDGKAGLFMEMRTGKTRASLVYVDWKKCERVLVICPLSVVGVWQDEAAKMGYSYDAIDLVSAGTIKQRAEFLRSVRKGLVIVNYESYWREPLRTAILRWQPDAVILDEAHRIRHRGSRLSRFAHSIHDRNVPIRLALTGTPIVNGLQDVWSLYRFIDAGVFGRRWKEFQNDHLIMGGFQNYEIKGYRDEEFIRRRIEETSYQATADHDIETEDVLVPVRLSPKTQEAYRELKKHSIAEIEQAGELKIVVARIALTALMRLQQITSGFIRDEETQDEVTISHEKLQHAVDLVEGYKDQNRKVVIFARFLHDVHAIAKALEGDTWESESRYRVAVMVGGQTSTQRTKIVRDFAAGKYDVIVAQIKVASLGIDLSSASAAIFYSVGFSLDEFLQAKARLLGPGQKRSVSFLHLVARGTVDEKVYAALQAKIQIAGRVTSLDYALDLLGK